MAVKTLIKSPPHLPGKDLSEYLRLNDAWVRSDVINYNSTSPVSLFAILANTLILSVILEVTTAWDGGIPSLSLGVSGAVSRHMGTNENDLKTAGLYRVARPYKYTSAATLIATLVADDAAAGAGYVWVNYVANTDNQPAVLLQH